MLNAKSSIAIFLATVGLVVGLTQTSRAEDSPELLDKQTKAYITIVYADDAMERGQTEEAKKQYADALTLYREIQKADPSWNTEMINFRIANCINVLEKIQRQQQKPAPTSPSTSDPSAKYYETRYQSAVKENDYLRSKISKLELELDEAEDSGDFQEQLNELRLQNSKLKSGQETVEDAFTEDLRKARDNTSSLRTQLDEQKQEMANLQLIRDRYDRLREQLQVSQTQRATLDERIDALTGDLEQKNSQIEQLENQTRNLKQNAENSASPEIIQSLEKQLNNEKNINRQLISQLKQADREKDELQKQTQQQKDQINGFSNQISTLLGREKEATDSLVGIRERIASLTQKNKALEAALTTTRQELSAPSEELNEAIEEQKALKLKLSEASRQRDLGLKTLNTQLSEIRALTVRNASIQKELEGIKEQTTAAPPKDQGQRAALQQTINDLETEREGLKQALQNAAEDLRTWKAQSNTQVDPQDDRVPKREYEALQGEMIDLRYEVTKLQNALAKSTDNTALKMAYEQKVAAFEKLEKEHSQLQQQYGATEGDHSSSTPNPSPIFNRKKIPDPDEIIPATTKITPSREYDNIPAAAESLSRGIKAEQQGNLDEALMAYDEVLSETPKNMAAIKGKIRVLLQQENPRDCLPLLEKGEKIDIKDLEVHLLEGMTWYQLENYRRAGSILRKLLRKEPANARAHNALGAVYMAEKDYFRSRDSFNNAVIHDASLSDAHFNLAQVARLSDPNNRVFIREHYEVALSLGAARDPSMEDFLNN